MNLNVTTVRYVLGIAVAMVLLVLLLVIGISFARGISGSQIVGLLSALGTLVALLAALVGAGAAMGQISDVQQKVNGHLETHQVQVQQMQSLVDDHLVQVRDVIDQRLRELGLTPPAPPAPPPGTPPAAAS